MRDADPVRKGSFGVSTVRSKREDKSRIIIITNSKTVRVPDEATGSLMPSEFMFL